MAFSLKYTISLSSDKTYITITNNGTTWGNGIDSLADITLLKLYIMGENKNVTLKNVLLTTSEKNNFSTGITLYFSDSRLFSSTYPPDNYYVCYLKANDLYESNWDAFEIHLGLQENIHINNASVNLRPQDLFQVENNIQAVIAVDTMTDLANEAYSPDREYRWRALYEYVVKNIINKY